MCVLGLGFNSRMVHFFSSTNDIIKSLQLLFCIDLYYYFYYSNIGCWEFQVEWWNPHGKEITKMVYFTLLHLFQVDSTGVQVDWWSPPGLHLECT